MQYTYFVHGDRNSQTGLYFCRKCDAFVQHEHFLDRDHVNERDRRVGESITTLRRMSANRPGEMARTLQTENFFAPELSSDILRRLKFDETFLIWLLHSTENDQILELAGDHPINKASPSYDDIRDFLDKEDQTELDRLYKKYISR